MKKIYGHVFFEDGGESEEEGQLVTARPRRVSELNMPNQTPPIPNASSFFVFSPTNRWMVMTLSPRYQCLIVLALCCPPPDWLISLVFVIISPFVLVLHECCEPYVWNKLNSKFYTNEYTGYLPGVSLLEVRMWLRYRFILLSMGYVKSLRWETLDIWRFNRIRIKFCMSAWMFVLIFCMFSVYLFIINKLLRNLYYSQVYHIWTCILIYFIFMSVNYLAFQLPIYIPVINLPKLYML